MKIVVADDYNDAYGRSATFATLRDRAEVAIYTTPHQSLDELVERMRGAEIIVANRERLPLKADLFDRLPDLKFVAQTGRRGVHMDLDAATQRGILFAGTGGSSRSDAANPTAELTVAIMLAAARQIPRVATDLKAGKWNQTLGRELGGKLLGVIGLGRIGGHVARICQAIGMRVCAWGPTLTPERAAAAGVELTTLEDLLGRADVVTVHLQLSERSRGLLSREKLALMKPSALFVNTARAAITDEAALVDMLRAGRLWGAALDVFSVEPLPADHPLLSLDNVVLTPHEGYVSEGGFEQFAQDVTANINAYLDGREVPNMLNPEALSRRR
ncbi:MAG: D-2-hydroxyacid dehydrogenase family protein [Chloroflexota bacterium]